MAKQPVTKFPADPAPRVDPYSSAVRAYILSALGHPNGVREVQVHLLWEGHYRVNVVVGPNAVEVRIAHSFFLVLDGDGNLAFVNPDLAGGDLPPVLAKPLP
jgi:hypothetical protein